MNLARRFAHRRSLPGKLVKRHALVFQGRISWRYLVYPSPKTLEHLDEAFFLNVGNSVFGSNGTGGILRIRFNSEAKHGLVGFVSLKEKSGQPGSPVDATHQDTRGKWVQCTGVPHLFGSQVGFDPRDNPGGRHIFGFIDDDNAIIIKRLPAC